MLRIPFRDARSPTRVRVRLLLWRGIFRNDNHRRRLACATTMARWQQACMMRHARSPDMATADVSGAVLGFVLPTAK